MTLGTFCQLFGAGPKNRILEFFLEMKSLDFSCGDIAEETGLPRATVYKTMDLLVRQRYVVPTRRVSGVQLYRLHVEKREVQLLLDVFRKVIKSVADQHHTKQHVLTTV